MSQQRYAEGLAAGAFTSELTPVNLKPIKGVPQSLEADEHPRPQSTLASLQKLPSVFIKGSGVVTAGNASGICDGGAANVLMSEEAMNKYGVRPLARIASYAWSACEPEIMGIGPVVAVREALKKVGKSVGEMDIIELNEVSLCHPGVVEFKLTFTSRRLLLSGLLFRRSSNFLRRRPTCLAVPLLLGTLSPRVGRGKYNFLTCTLWFHLTDIVTIGSSPTSHITFTD